jgi:hypothetical protein
MEENKPPEEKTFLQRHNKEAAVIMGVIAAIFFSASLMLLPPFITISITAGGQPAYIGYGALYYSLLMICELYAAIQYWRTYKPIWVRINIVLFFLNAFTFWLNY